MKVVIHYVDSKFHTKRKETCTVSGQVSLGYALREQGVRLSYDCGGNGICGKCLVRFLTGAPQPTEREKTFFQQDKLQQGYRLACESKIVTDCEIEILEADGEVQSIATESSREKIVADDETGEYGVAVDLGTTTIALALVDIEKKMVLKAVTIENSQRSYGADVMSRMQQSLAGEAERLQKLVIGDIEQGIQKLFTDCFKHSIPGDEVEKKIKQMVIAGNTTMCHLLLGYSCESLAVAPFQPVSVKKEIRSYRGIQVTVFPGASAFIGGDVVAGLSALSFEKNYSPKLLLDLGTNGEMVLWANHKYYATSASAGPALEGGNISCGCASIRGAICDVMIAGKRNQIKTIGNAPAVGICGSGLISLISGMRRNHIIDEQGIFAEEFHGEYVVCDGRMPTERKVSITQEDVQNFQLAKSAICSGVEYLLSRMPGKTQQQKLEIYLAGGLGVHLPVQAAVEVGLFPRSFAGQIKTVGNTSLQGAVEYLLEPETKNECIQNICTQIEVLPMNEWPDFESVYVENLILKRK